MNERKYRSGAQQSCLLCRQSPEIQEKVKKLAATSTYQEIVNWLRTKEIIATTTQVRTFLVNENVPPRLKTISSNGTYKDRLIAYVTELLKHENNTYTIHTLGLKGPKWTPVSANLHKGGLIAPMREYTPIRWKIIATKDEIQEWYESEFKRLEEKEHTSHR